MARFEPFEDRPRLAVAVSGGADSTALAILAREWCAKRDGRIVALVVDHGLRPESPDEARAVLRQLVHRGIEAVLLEWRGDKPVTGIQAIARDARLSLLREACHQRKIAHLLLGHHRDDQNETIAMRAERQSGVIGRAGMSACRELDHLRLLRPLLEVRKSALRAYLEHRGESWVEDPSNTDPRFWRGRYRVAGKGTEPRSTAAERMALERALARFAAEAVSFDSLGYLSISGSEFDRQDRELRYLIVTAAVTAVTGRACHLRRERLERLMNELSSCPVRRTLGHAMFERRENEIRVVREIRHLPRAAPLPPAMSTRWDDRFTIETGSIGDGWMIGPADAESIVRLRENGDCQGKLPVEALASWPALCAPGCAEWQHMLAFRARKDIKVLFEPARGLTGSCFMGCAVVCGGKVPM